MFNYPNYSPYQQPYNPQNFQQQYQQPQQSSPDERIFVANATAAEAYLVAAGGFVRLWDSSKPLFYEKQADFSGRQSPMKVYEYHEFVPQNEKNPINDYEERLKVIEYKIAALEKGAMSNE